MMMDPAPPQQISPMGTLTLPAANPWRPVALLLRGEGKEDGVGEDKLTCSC